MRSNWDILYQSDREYKGRLSFFIAHKEMFKRAIKKIWSLLAPSTRAKLVRATQNSFTVSAAAIVTNERGEVLLLDHVLRPDSGWGLPGGFLDKGEQAEKAIRREVREETGLELELLKLNSIRTAGTHIEILFFARGKGDAEVKSREIVGLGWFAPHGMPDEMSQSQRRRVLEVLAVHVEPKAPPD